MITDAPRIITSRFDNADSFTLDGYEATGGYQALRKALSMGPTAVADEVKTATLLGRGGAGFPAGVKWGLAPENVWPRYLVVNGDESEPGTYKDRLLMERDPHQLIEGVLLACYAIGCGQAFLYVRGEMPLAQERIAAALNDAYAAGYVGKNILGSDFSVDVVLSWGAGAYIVGEETALIESLEGNRGMPRLKPPYFPAAKGLYMQPTIVNNVETLSNLPWIVTNGGEAFAALGAETSRGTRMFAVSGHVKNPGVFEVEYGVTTFRDLIYAPSTRVAFSAIVRSRRISQVAHRLRGSLKSTSTFRLKKSLSIAPAQCLVLAQLSSWTRPPMQSKRVCELFGSSPVNLVASAPRVVKARLGWKTSCSESKTDMAVPVILNCSSTFPTTFPLESHGPRSRQRFALLVRQQCRRSHRPCSVSAPSSRRVLRRPKRLVTQFP